MLLEVNAIPGSARSFGGSQACERIAGYYYDPDSNAIAGGVKALSRTINLHTTPCYSRFSDDFKTKKSRNTLHRFP